VNSLSHSFGVTAGRLRDEIRWRRLSVQSLLPNLNDTVFRLTKEQFQDVVAIFKPLTGNSLLADESTRELSVSIRTLAARLDIPPRELRTLLRETSSLPELHRSLHDDVEVYIRQSILQAAKEQVVQAQARHQKTIKTPPKEHPPTSTSPKNDAHSQHEHTVNSLSHSFGVTAGRLRDEIRWRRLSIQSLLPNLNDITFPLTKGQLAEISAVFRPQASGAHSITGSDHGQHVSVRSLATRLGLPPGRLRKLLRKTSCLPELHQSSNDDVEFFIRWETLRSAEYQVVHAFSKRDTMPRKEKTARSRAKSLSSIAHRHSLTVTELRNAILDYGGIEGITVIKNGKLSIAVDDHQMLILSTETLEKITTVAELAKKTELTLPNQSGLSKQGVAKPLPLKTILWEIGLIIAILTTLRIVITPLLT